MKKTKFLISVSILFLILLNLSCKDLNQEIPISKYPTPVIFPANALEVKVDDCDDNDNVNAWGGYWFTFDDTKAPNYGISEVNPRNGAQFTMSYVGPDWPGGLGTNLWAARMWGTVKRGLTGFAYPFIGMGTGLSPDEAPKDISGFTGIKFWAKRGSSDNVNSYRISFKHANVTDPSKQDYYGFIFWPSTSWQQFNIKFSQFTQQAWSQQLDKMESLRLVQGIQFQTKNPDPAPGQEFISDLWIDSIILYRE